MQTQKLVFFGEDSFSDIVLRSLIEAHYDVRLVVVPWFDNVIYKRLELTCRKFGIQFLRVHKINSDEVCQAVRACNPDLGVIVHLSRLIRHDLMMIPTYGYINLHPALLPDYRGETPQHWPLINREKKAGITVHYIDETADTGDIIVQRVFDLNEEMYVSDLQLKWREEYKTIVVEALEAIREGRPVVHQKNLAGRYYGKLSESDRIIDMAGSVYDAYAKVRALSLPYCGAICGDFVVYRAHISSYDRMGVPFRDGSLVLDTFKSLHKCKEDGGLNGDNSQEGGCHA